MKPSTLAVHIPKMARSGLEKAELSGQDTTLCPQLHLPSLDQQKVWGPAVLMS